MSKHAVSAITALRPILPAHLQAGSAVPKVEIKRIPGIPFFRDSGHTTPTKRLYRQILRSTSKNNRDGSPEAREVDWIALRNKVRADWRKRKGWTSIPQTQAFLDTQLSFFHTLTSSSAENTRTLVDLSHKLSAQQRRAHERAIPAPSLQPYVAGFLRPSFNNPPIPRIKPQPLSLTLTILSRVRARARRVALQKDLAAQSQELKEEINFYRRVRDREGLEDTKLFLAGLRERQADLQVLFDRHERRKAGVYSEKVVGRVMKAKVARQTFKRHRAEERKRQSIV